MSRPSLVSLSLAVFGLLMAAAVPVSAAQPATADAAAATKQTVKVSVPASTKPGTLTAVIVKLPSNVAAVDGRILIAKGAAQLVGVAPVNGGTGLLPEQVKGGYAFGAYDLRAYQGKTILQLVINPLKAGKLQVRVLIDSTSSKAGVRIGAASSTTASVGVTGSSRALTAPSASSVASFSATRPASGVRKLIGTGKVDTQDLDAARLAWDQARRPGFRLRHGRQR